MTPAEYAALRSNAAAHTLLDVRTAEELAIARIDPCIHIPLHELSQRLQELEAHKHLPIVCLCHHGVRSGMATAFLRERGFQQVHNLSGGIDAYARDVDSTLPTY